MTLELCECGHEMGHHSFWYDDNTNWSGFACDHATCGCNDARPTPSQPKGPNDE